MDARDALDLALGGKALVEALGAKGADLFGPGREPLGPALDAILERFGIASGQIGANSNHRLEGDRASDHIIGVAPTFVPNLSAGFEKIADHGVITFGAAFVCSLGFDLGPGLLYPAMNFVEELGLQDPFLLFAAPAQTID